MMTCAVMGCERTGTNLVEALVNAYTQYTSIRDILGYTEEFFDKHIPDVPTCDRSVAVVKHPLAWLDSLHRHGWIFKWMTLTPEERSGEARVTCAQTFEDFLETRGAPERWNHCYLAWEERVDLFVKYESILKNPKRVVEEIAGGRQHVKHAVRLPSNKMGLRSDETLVPFSADYYLAEVYEHRYTPELRERTMARFDQRLLDRLEYQ